MWIYRSVRIACLEGTEAALKPGHGTGSGTDVELVKLGASKAGQAESKSMMWGR